MNKIKTLTILLFLSTHVFTQEVTIPDDLKLEKAEDYKNSEELVLNCIDWLSNTSFAENPEKRSIINAFLITWMSGSPNVSIEIVPGIVAIDCLDCLISFMSGWTKYSLENNYSNNKIECALAGAENAIAFYLKNKSKIGKHSDMEKLVKRKNKGKLKKYIESKF